MVNHLCAADFSSINGRQKKYIHSRKCNIQSIKRILNLSLKKKIYEYKIFPHLLVSTTSITTLEF